MVTHTADINLPLCVATTCSSCVQLYGFIGCAANMLPSNFNNLYRLCYSPKMFKNGTK